MTKFKHGALRVGVGGPVGSGKTALVDALCKSLRSKYDIAVITNDIYTKEDAEFLTRSGALPPERIMGVETGGGPPTPIPGGAAHNPAALADIRTRLQRPLLRLPRIRRPQSAPTLNPQR